MHKDIHEKFNDFVKRFDESDNKPSLQTEFEDLFLEIINELDDCREVEFLGEGAYDGVNFLINLEKCYISHGIKIELELTKTGLTAYSAFHNGFWVPPFMIAKPGCSTRYKEIRTKFVDKIKTLMMLD